MSKVAIVAPAVEVDRSVVLGPFPATVKVSADAERTFFMRAGKRVYYLVCRHHVLGGVMEMYVFGDAVPGDKVNASVEVKTKTNNVTKKTTHYVRAEVLPDGGKVPDHRLFVGNPNEAAKLDPEASSMVIEEERRKIRVGFIRK